MPNPPLLDRLLDPRHRGVVRRATLSAAVACWAALAGGCIIGDLDLSERQCPCYDGYHCDHAIDRCVLGPAPIDAGTADAGVFRPDAGDPLPAIVVSDLRADWTTPHTIRWTWTVAPGAEASDLFAYELAVWEGEETAPVGLVDVTRDQNPELGRYFIPHGASTPQVVATITRDHTASRTYFAQLTAIDTASRRARSNIARASTADLPLSAYVLFEEALPAGAYTLPACLTVGDGSAAAGTFALATSELHCTSDDPGTAYCSPQAAPAEQCWGNLTCAELTADLSALSEGDFATAYLEIWVSYTAREAAAHAWWSELGLRMAGDYFAFGAVTIPANGEWRLHEIPLSELRFKRPDGSFDRALARTDLARTVTGFAVGSEWRDASVVRIDEVRIRW